MGILIAGLALFMAPHILGFNAQLKAQLQQRFGAAPYKGVHAALSLGGVVLMVIGFQNAEFTELYTPMQSRIAAHSIMPLAVILVAGAHMKSNLKRFVRHPMALGVLIWALTHISLNGDLASVLLFGAFALFALANMLASPAAPAPAPVSNVKDVILVVAGLVAYGAIVWAHGAIGGVPVSS